MSTPYELYYTDRKTLGIKVYPDTSVKVFAPIDTDLPIIEQLLKAKRKWIEKQQRSFQTYLPATRSEEHTSELQSHDDLVCRLLLEKKKQNGRAHV